MKKLIFAPPGAGKSYFISLNPNLPLIDGDDLIAETIGWPPGKWWKTMTSEQKDLFAEEVDRVLLKAEGIILFAPDWKRTKIIPDLLVIPPLEIMVRNFLAKAKAGVVNQPTVGAQRARDEWLRFASWHPSVKVMEDFEGIK